MVKTLEAEAGDRQQGAVRAGGADFPHMVAIAWMKQATKRRKSAAMIFTDIKAAFYSVATEVGLEPFLGSEEGGAWKML